MRRKYQICEKCDGAGDDDVGGGGGGDIGVGDGGGDDGGGDDDVGSNGSGSLLRGNINTQLAKQLRNRLLPCAGVISPLLEIGS